MRTPPVWPPCSPAAAPRPGPRPSCRTTCRRVQRDAGAGVELLRRAVMGFEIVTIAADRDEPGQRGADALKVALIDMVQRVRIWTPPQPHGDLRDCVLAGMDGSDLERLGDFR